MDRIAIVGIAGSGKSTLAAKLGEELKRPVIYLDKYYYTSSWEKNYKKQEEWHKFLDELIVKEKWIIDGNYRNTIKARLKRADTIIFLDFPKWRCLWRVFKRRILNKKQQFDKPDGAKERISWHLIKLIINHPYKEIRSEILEHKNTKKLFISKTDRQTQNIFKELIDTAYYS